MEFDHLREIACKQNADLLARDVGRGLDLPEAPDLISPSSEILKLFHVVPVSDVHGAIGRRRAAVAGKLYLKL